MGNRKKQHTGFSLPNLQAYRLFESESLITRVRNDEFETMSSTHVQIDLFTKI